MVDHVLRSEDRTLFVSVLAAVEVRSAIRRRCALGDIDPDDAEFAIMNATEETRRFVQQPILESTLRLAEDMVDKNRLRALDALQLASSLITKTSLSASESFLFICSDRKLLEAAKREGMQVWDPTDVEIN